MTAYCSFDHTPNDSSAITCDGATSEVTIETSDNLSGIDMNLFTPVPPMVYTVTVYMETDAGTKHDTGGEEMSFTVTMTDPCHSATIDLTGVVANLSPSYTIGEVADVQQFIFANADDGVSTSCPAI